MTSIVSRLSSALLQCEDSFSRSINAEVLLLPRAEVEQWTIKSESLLNITDFQRYMVETNGARLSSAMAILLVDEKRRSPDQGAIVDLRTIKSATSARLIVPNRQSFGAVRTR